MKPSAPLLTYFQRLAPIVVLLTSHVLGLAQESLSPVINGVAPQTFSQMWDGYDPTVEPLEVEVLKEWEEDGVTLKVIRYRIGIFKGQKSMMAGIYGCPKSGDSFPGLVQIHGGGQYADYRSVLTNARRGYATLSIAWAGRINAPDYKVDPAIVKLFWAGATDNENYKVTTDWSALDAYHAPSRYARNGFASTAPAAWTLDAVDSPRNNPWFLCTLAARRAITFLEQQPEVDSDRLGVYGHSMGGKLTVMVAAADARIKAAAPSCGGISNRPVDNKLYENTIADAVNLKHIDCPIIFLSPSNDFHGRLNDLPKAVQEVSSPEWRVTCSPHGNHQDTGEYQITGLLWFDQCLKKSFTFPETPETRLDLTAADGVPIFSVQPDTSMQILSVDIFYTQHGQPAGKENDRENTMNRFWRHGEVSRNGDSWQAQLPLTDTSKPLWAYANVLYALDDPQSGAGYYYSLYTAESFNLSSLVQIVEPGALQAAGAIATLKPTHVIETFESGWEKEWFSYNPEQWPRRTHKVYDAQWLAPVDGQLAFNVRASQPNALVVGIDQYAAEVSLSGGDAWQSVKLNLADFENASGESLEQWVGIKELRLGDKETLRSKSNGKDIRKALGANWKGPKPEFRNLRWNAKHDYDLVVYGGTSAGVMTAVQAKKLGKSVVIVGPDKHLGGLTSGGLGWTDTGNKGVIGGLARDFYHRVWTEYQKDETWVFQEKSEYGGKGQGTPAADGKNRTMWIFEPRVAEKVFEDYVAEFDIPVHRDEWLDREKGVTSESGRIVSIAMLSGKKFAGKVFIDATYEGDLMAAAGVDYHVGREGRDIYGEEWNGVQTSILHHRHHFGAVPEPVSPYVVSGDPESGVLPGISAEHPGNRHDGDNKVQAYCFRMCLTDDPENRIPFTEPDGYDASQYELLARIYAAGWRETFDKFDPIPNHKTDTNNHGPMSTDNIGFNYDYPDASYARRREILEEHEAYQKGWLWFHCADPRVPDDIQKKFKSWGLPKDEFVDNGHWSHQLYIREARRMIGALVMTENELLQRKATPDSVGMGSYTIDSHNTQRYITPEGFVQNEGDIGVKCPPYKIAYGALLPKKDQCQNLLVPVCVSSSHIAFGSIRMEPVFMILGQSAGTAAVIAIDRGCAVQDVSYEQLRTQLLADGQVLDYISPGKSSWRVVDPKKLGGLVIDDTQAITSGLWKTSSANAPFIGSGYQHDGNRADGKAIAKFQVTLPKSGNYEVQFGYTPNANRATNVPVAVESTKGQQTIVVNQRNAPPINGTFVSLGEFTFGDDQPATVSISNVDTDGYVVIDSVRFLAKEK
ncbi:MAG: cephalosporin-C deacetylase-like acetyl esterase [Verrucomicrobiales bacterium]|jgi:cephalosporin-C deacetylase-like acetyl esterase